MSIKRILVSYYKYSGKSANRDSAPSGGGGCSRSLSRRSRPRTTPTLNPLTEPDQQYTILDGLRLLSDDKFRSHVLTRLSDPYLLEWWSRDFGQ